MDEKKYKQILTIVVIGALIMTVGLYFLASITSMFTRTFGYFDKTATNIAYPRGYFAWFKTANVLIMLLFIAIIVMTISMLAMDKETKKSKIFAWSTLGCYIAIIFLAILVFCTLPSAPTLGTEPTHGTATTGLTGLAITMRDNIVALGLYSLVFMLVASWQIWANIFGKKKAAAK